MRILVGLFFLLLGVSAQASVLFTYTGSNYTVVWNSVDTPIQESTAPPVPLDTTMSVSIDLVFEEALVNNGHYVLSLYSDTQIYDAWSGDYATDLLSYSFSDGINTLSSDNNLSEITYLEIWFLEGEVVDWALEANSVVDTSGYYDIPALRSRISTYSGGPPPLGAYGSYTGDTSGDVYDDISYSQPCSTDADCDGPSTYYFSGAAITSSAGSWSASVVPIPAAVWLFGSALAGLGWMRRKRTA
jgi:hypothetical protein